MVKKIATLLLGMLLLFALAACGGAAGGTDGGANNSDTNGGGNNNEDITPLPPAEKTEEELLAENPLFSSALPADQPFTAGGITFEITAVTVNPSPNEDNPTKTIKVFIDYPYEIKTVAHTNFSVCDVENAEYESVLPDGLDYMGQYREEGKDGRVTFIVPRKYDHYLLKAEFPNEDAVYVHFNLNDY